MSTGLMRKSGDRRAGPAAAPFQAGRRTKSLFAGLLMMLLSLAVAIPADAILPGRNGRIAFTSGREGPNDNLAQLYLREVTCDVGCGNLIGPITPVGGQSRHPSWSPDRERLVFANGTFTGNPATEDYDLFIKDFVNDTITPLDGTEVGNSLSSDHAAWSPDGTRIAYETQPTDNSAERDIMVKTVGSAAPAVNLTSGAPVEFKPAWSPDSEDIYYATTTAMPSTNLDIVMEPATGGAVTPVANASGVDEYQPSISPDGSKICFTLQTTPGNSATAEIYTAFLPSLTGLTNLSDDPTRGDINCTWSPDGQYIAYVNGTFSQGRLVMERADDSDLFPTELEQDMGGNNFDGNPDWAPDGSPDCPDLSVTTRPDTPITIELECTDTGPQYERTDPSGFVTNNGEPANGTLSDFAPLDNPSTVRYTPNSGFRGTDQIIYGSFDDYGFGTDTGEVTINVRPLRCAGRAATIPGTPGPDTLLGTPGPDVFVAGMGNDTISGRRGNDVACGGPGRDRITLGTGRDRAGGGGGLDRIAGGAQRDRLAGGGGPDRISGNGGPDRLFGNAGRDRLFGGAGRDVCRGGRGRDVARCEVGR